MTKRNWASVYALACVILMLAGCITVFWLAWDNSAMDLLRVILGVVLGFIFAPIFHEFGHILFARAVGMQVAYSKFFCFKLVRDCKRLRVRLASPFSPEETQVVPRGGEKMLRRAVAYTLGGLILSTVFVLVNVVCACVANNNYVFLGILPYAGYLLLLNVAPFEYTTGKTDMLVFLGLRRGDDVGKTMLRAMEIFGELHVGKTYAEMDETLYFDLPQLAEDEPLFAVMLDLRYRYFLEKDEIEKAADCLNRLVVSQDYLSDLEREKLAAECVYLHALNGDYERAQECGTLCEEYLAQPCVTAKRILAAYSSAFGKTDAVEPLKAQAQEAMQQEWIVGNAKFEQMLLDRIQSA